LSPDDLIDAFQSAICGRVRNAFSGCCAEDIHYEDPLSVGPCEGYDEIADHVARLWQAFPDARLERAGERLHDGRFIAAPLRLVGTHGGDLTRLPATQRPLSLHGVLYCELDADAERLWRVRAFYDPYDAGVQLGVLPAHGSLGERALFLMRGFGLRATG
jgi:hypothetical protein